MITPTIKPGVKQSDNSLLSSVHHSDAVGLVDVTRTARKSPIGFIIPSTKIRRDYVFDFKCHVEDSFWRSAILALVRGTLRNQRVTPTHRSSSLSNAEAR
jgi:hypothetical protein